MAKTYVRPFTPVWRWLIAGSSLTAFIGGWAIVAHTPNPYQTSASAATVQVPAIEQAPAPNTDPFSFQNSPRNQRQRQFEQLPSQGFDSSPQRFPNSQNQLRRLRSGGS
jgi:hypothetical protein